MRDIFTDRGFIGLSHSAVDRVLGVRNIVKFQKYSSPAENGESECRWYAVCLRCEEVHCIAVHHMTERIHPNGGGEGSLCVPHSPLQSMRSAFINSVMHLIFSLWKFSSSIQQMSPLSTVLCLRCVALFFYHAVGIELPHSPLPPLSPHP